MRVIVILFISTLYITVSCRKEISTSVNDTSKIQSLKIIPVLPDSDRLKFRNSNEQPFVSLRAHLKSKENDNIFEIKGMGGTIETEVPAGVYEVEVVAYVKSETGKKERNIPYSAKQEMTVDGGNLFTVPLTIANPFIDLKIEEIFYGGTSGDTRDQYFKITNNGDVEVALDNLVIMEGAFVNSAQRVYIPNIIDTAFAIHSIYRVPKNAESIMGNGGYIILADQAIDHTITNPNSRDLSLEADYEWFDENSMADVGNDQVARLECIYNLFPTWVLNNRGFRSYAIGVLPVTAQEFLTQYKYTPAMPGIGGTWWGSPILYAFPNSWIADGVNLCPTTAWEWNSLYHSIDAGYTGIDVGDQFDRSVIRKKNRYGKLIDTNNSTNDFTYGGQMPTVY